MYNRFMNGGPVLESMNTPQRFFIILTLSLLLLGLVGHNLSVASFSACSENQIGGAGLDACLVCQLQTGVYVTSGPPNLAANEPLNVNSSAGLPPQEHAVEISHPPILF